jgi:predicted AAA+ superfamily ATPase
MRRVGKSFLMADFRKELLAAGGKKKGAKSVNGISHNTVATYLTHLAGAFVLHKADRFDIHGKKLLKTQQK